MNRRPFPKFTLLSLLALSFLATAALPAADIRVFAAASLTDAMRQLAPAYEAKSGNRLIFNFAGSNVLARQIKEGAPADIFFSADDAQMDRLAKAGLINPATRKDLLSNLLVIVVPENGLAKLAPADLASPAVKRLALADPRSVPAGVYAREYLTKLGLWKSVAPKVIPTENVRAALAAVESGNADAGIVYKTDAGVSKAVKIAFEVPRAEGPKIVYPAAVLTAGPDAAAATNFMNYMQSKEGMAVFKKLGFLPVSG